MCLRSGTNEMDDSELADFANWILKIGEGKLNLPNDGEADIDFPDDILLKTNENPIETIIDSTYPRLRENMSNPKFFQDRAILAPTNEQVDSINDHVLSNIDGDEKVYYSSDSLCPDEDDDLFAQQLYSPEILNELKVPGVPNHKLALKVGVPIMLLRNIDQSKVAPTDNKIAVRFQRRQFPISVCFSMTINKSQGQSLANVGLYLRKPVFTHGQLYVAVSRVTSKKGLKVVLLDDKGKDTCKTKNVVYKEGCSHQLPICFSTFLLLPNYVGVKEIFKGHKLAH
ncbi:ATP-dependent DNA helicase PIF1-like [Rutidosis leptorrhynchoides]|uniref:ATP-dependent DNA helicase PIF1-like n=1 Tax=Rutidosis leptorrhynchoides TaxID=125765 RepID=UPI003A995C07